MTETAKFTANFDKFFDALNVKSLNEGKHKQKDFRLPYTSADDSRLDVSSYSRSCLIKYTICVPTIIHFKRSG